MYQATLKCNSVYTPVVAEGRWVEEQIPSDGNKHVVIVIPGNPGVPEFYLDFIKSLKVRLPTETPVWLIPHAGHSLPPGDLIATVPNDLCYKRYFDLSGQVQHKIRFISDHVPKDAILHVIGHSIGAFMALELLRTDFIRDKVVKCYLLFPTIERMAESWNGWFFINIMARLAPVLIFVSWIFSFFPSFLQSFFVRLFGLLYGVPSKDTKAMLQLFKPQILKNVFFLANDEMQKVRELDHQHVSRNASKLWLYYGRRDGWVPVSYYHDLVSAHPNIKAELCKQNILHSFVLKHSKVMANIVADIINENIISFENQNY